MEKRLLLFFAVTFLIMSLWWRIFPPTVPEPEAPPETTTESVEKGESESGPQKVAAQEEEPSAAREVEKPGQPERREEASEAPEVVAEKAAEQEERVVVDTDVYHLEVSNRGGRLVSATLKGYEDGDGNPYELVDEKAAAVTGSFPLDLQLESTARTKKVKEALFTVGTEGARTITGDEHFELVLSWSDGLGLEVDKRLGFTGKEYSIEVEVSVRDHGAEIPKGVLFGPGLGREEVASRYVSVEKGVVVSRAEVIPLAPKALDQEVSSESMEEGAGVRVDAAGVMSHYFAALMIPRGDESSEAEARFWKESVPSTADAKPDSHKERDVITAALEAPRSKASFRLFMGPKQYELLETLGPGYTKLIEFGSWMRYPALLLRKGLMGLHAFVGNYGWAIVLLTVCINLLLVPLKHYSFVSMRKMQKLSPQIQRIRERYKKVKPTDPRYQHMNQEIMDLYKEHKVSPVSGCLPMLLMIPFFFAFYRLLMTSIELRQAPFILWIHDLSQHDPYYVLPILMGLSQIVIQRMTPQTTADPVQAKIMSFMPIMFTFILALAPSGLVLYWFSNNLVSAGQQIITNRMLTSAEDGDGGVKSAKAKKSAKHAQARS